MGNPVTIEGVLDIIAADSGGGDGTVKSVNLNGGDTGLTASGGPITTTGTITLGGTLATGSGGTGLTSLGSAGQTLQVNSGGNALEYATPSKMAFSLRGQSGSTQTITDSNTVTVQGATNATTGLTTTTTASATDTMTVEVSSGTLAQTNGGTGVDFTAQSAGTLLIGTGEGLAAVNTLTQGANIETKNGAGEITISAIATSVTDTTGMAPLFLDTANGTFHYLEEKKEEG